MWHEQQSNNKPMFCEQQSKNLMCHEYDNKIDTKTSNDRYNKINMANSKKITWNDQHSKNKLMCHEQGKKKSSHKSYDGNNREGRSKCDESYHHIGYKVEKHSHPIDSNPINCFDNNLTYTKSVHDQ